MLYRLNGDFNPLHSDPDVPKHAGFSRPSLRGLSTFAITCRAVLRESCNCDPTRIVSHEARFSRTARDAITVDLWRHVKVISFEARLIDRCATVIKNGEGRAVLLSISTSQLGDPHSYLLGPVAKALPASTPARTCPLH
ncbi:MaoC/PaaZ C-terminal domain-containing protein [Bradyrhizobium sp. CCBAU 45384]|uniref:MaoC/PaaZ C-terminal domain-containing protein n=1 Tax=Bradyrhizobium sp. CCBAU 45384 TaxID=858428 RepID=UPI003FA40E8D